ncbi:MAG: hypothetical protein L7U72_00555 [Rubripirellula sp.]|nr:hypothetical protein [Rubripirellula sp.]
MTQAYKTGGYILFLLGIYVYVTQIAPLTREVAKEKEIYKKASENTRRGQYYLGVSILMEEGDPELALKWFRESAERRFVPSIKKLTLTEGLNSGSDAVKWSLVNRHYEALTEGRAGAKDQSWRLIRQEVGKLSPAEIADAANGFRDFAETLKNGFYVKSGEFLAGAEDRVYARRGKFTFWKEQWDQFADIVSEARRSPRKVGDQADEEQWQACEDVLRERREIVR